MTSVVTTLAAWRALTADLVAQGATIGLTMTMGALHEGHASLLAAARTSCDVSLATVFVNPLQFGDAADLERYPRSLDADVAMCDAQGALAVLAPEAHEMWPSWPASTPTSVHVAGVTDRFEGEGRPGHFDGVATVVTKLLVATQASRAFFGEKDFQQLCMVRRLASDLALPVEIVGCPIVRDHDGLALSSRNARLTATGHATALALPRALGVASALVAAGATVDAVEAAMHEVAATATGLDLAYAAVVEPATLEPVRDATPGRAVRLLIAGIVEGVRLIDNAPATFGRQR